MERVAQEVVDLESPDDIALADRMKHGRDQIITELRKLIIGLFILTSLTAQASTAFACAMMGQVVMHECCCHGKKGHDAPAVPDDSCCTQITLVGADDGTHVSGTAVKLQLPDFQPQLLTLIVVAEIEAPQASYRYAWADPPEVLHAGSLTYLRTQRLRI